MGMTTQFKYTKLYDGCLMLEFKRDNQRFALYFEKIIEDSSWSFIEKEGDVEGGTFDKEFIDQLREQLKEEQA